MQHNQLQYLRQKETVESLTYRDNREAFEVIVPNQALYRVQVTDMISQRRHNRLTGALNMSFSGLPHAHVEISIHVPLQEGLSEEHHTNHVDNQMLTSEHSIFSYSDTEYIKNCLFRKSHLIN